jgi:hypothetical protein
VGPMRPLIASAALALVALAGCGVETVQIERQPASAFTDDQAEATAYDDAHDRCSQAKDLRELANKADSAGATPDAIARNFGEREDDPEIASAVYSGCLDGIEQAKLKD